MRHYTLLIVVFKIVIVKEIFGQELFFLFPDPVDWVRPIDVRHPGDVSDRKEEVKSVC